MYGTQGEHANHYTNDVVLKHTMYSTQGEHANHYTNDVVLKQLGV
jgi:hypothetical protein